MRADARCAPELSTKKGQLVAMLYGQFRVRQELREIVTGLFEYMRCGLYHVRRETRFRSTLHRMRTHQRPVARVQR